MITRFAPSPTGPLHLGHAYSALLIWDMAAKAGTTPLLRIEDNDSTRSRPAFIQGIYDDLDWLGLAWHAPPRRQSDHLGDYNTVLDELAQMGLVYPCHCTRRDIISAGATQGEEGYVYPGTCRHRGMTSAGIGDAIRLDLGKIQNLMPKVTFTDTGPLQSGTHSVNLTDMIAKTGDLVLRRRENGDIAYLLACTHDDAVQNITHVIRGDDLWGQTAVQVMIQTLMGWPTPTYYHHDLIRDQDGKRLAKIAKSQSLANLRQNGATPDDIRRMVGLCGQDC